MKGGEKMKREQLWVIIVVALVVAVIASVATVSITGDIVKVRATKTGQTVYTAAEVDAKLSALKTQLDSCCPVNENQTEISYLQIASNPTGAKVYIYNSYIGVTPLVFSGYAGSTLTVVISKQGYNNYSETKYLSAGTDTMSVTLTPTTTYTGTLSVTSNPTGANLYVDNLYKGVTPITVSGLSVGNHPVYVAKAGYNTYMTTKAIYPGNNTMSVTLTPL